MVVFGSLIALNIYPSLLIYTEFLLVMGTGRPVDLLDIFAYSIVPITTVIFGIYSFIRYVVLPRIDGEAITRWVSSLKKLVESKNTSNRIDSCIDYCYIHTVNQCYTAVHTGK